MQAGPCIPASGEGAPPNRELMPAPWILPTPSSHSQPPQFSSSSCPAASPIPGGAVHSCHLTQVLLSLQGTLALTPRPCRLWLPLTSPLKHRAPPTSAPPWNPPPVPGSQHALPPHPAHPSTCWPLARAAGLLSSRPLSYSSGHSGPPSHLGLQQSTGRVDKTSEGSSPTPCPQTGRPGPDSGAGQRKSLWRV